MKRSLLLALTLAACDGPSVCEENDFIPITVDGPHITAVAYQHDGSDWRRAQETVDGSWEIGEPCQTGVYLVHVNWFCYTSEPRDRLSPIVIDDLDSGGETITLDSPCD
jgi:hypothetical protein